MNRLKANIMLTFALLVTSVSFAQDPIVQATI